MDFEDKNYFKDITYTDKDDTPLRWHNFMVKVLVPLSIVGQVFTLIQSLLHFKILTALISLVFLALSVVFEIGQKKWRKYTYYAVLLMYALSGGYTLLFNLSENLLTIMTYGLIIYYYYKRRMLFDDVPHEIVSSRTNRRKKYPGAVAVNNDVNTKTDIEEEITEEKQEATEETEETVEEKVAVALGSEEPVMKSEFKYCRYCGTKLPIDSMFCTDCGEKQ
ncbi:MAG: zinc ribbon domain-containing protein [Erysipelotrichaceae bacterium]|nr:zinc ribbon domain-containing protein [Erysipelotrichaceae bacterium]